MSQSAEKIATLLSVMDTTALDSSIKKLTLEQIKILCSNILPEIHQPQLYHLLKTLITEISPEEESSENDAVQQNETLTYELSKIYEILTEDFILELKDEALRKALLLESSDDELVVLKRRLSLMQSSDLIEALQDDVETEIIKRAIDSTKPKIDTHLQWQNLFQKRQNLRSELNQPLEKEVLEFKKPEPSRMSKLGAWITNAMMSVIRGISKVVFFIVTFLPFLYYKLTNKTPEKPKPEALEPPPDKFTKEEEAQLEFLRLRGARESGDSKRNQKGIETSLQTRFGMVLASQMVAATENTHHRELNTVVESLTRDTDRNALIKSVHVAMSEALGKSDAGPLSGCHIGAKEGDPDIVTTIESRVIEKLVNTPQNFGGFGLNLSKEDKAKIELYHQNMKATTELSHILNSVYAHMGGYACTDPRLGEPAKGYKKIENDFDVKQKEYSKYLSLASRKLQSAIHDLNDGSSLFLETGLEEHAMKLVIKREGDNLKLSTYDSSGALENTALAEGGLNQIKNSYKDFWTTALQVGLWAAITNLFTRVAGLVQLRRLGEHAMRKNALSFSIPRTKIQSSEGLAYLKNLIHANSQAGIAETHIRLNFKTSSMEERSHMGLIDQLSALNERANVYSEYIKTFTSIASEDSPPAFQDLLQRPQNTQNCFAKKAQSCELYELGKGTYKKVRLAMLIEQRDAILNEIIPKESVPSAEATQKFVNPNYLNMIRNIEPEYLSPDELHEASMQLCELKKVPNDEYYEQYFIALLDAKVKLMAMNKPQHQKAIDRIQEKILNHAKAFYLYLKNSDQKEEIATYFDSKFFNLPVDQWPPDAMPLKMDKQTFHKEALQGLSAFANARAWKAIIQILNHQIKKLSVRERHIDSENEHLPHASSSDIRHVRFDDLLHANVACYVTGIDRKEEVFIEVNIHGKMKALSVATFFNLVLEHNTSLTHPNVVGLLDYVRNASPTHEKLYIKNVFAAQKKAFKDYLAENIEKTEKNKISSLAQLSEAKEKLEGMLQESEILMTSLMATIEAEKSRIGPEKTSTNIKNLQSRLSLLTVEKEELTRLRNSVDIRINELNHLIGITKASEIYQQLSDEKANFFTINAVSHLFTAASNELNQVEKTLEKNMKGFEINDIEEQFKDRSMHINQYRKELIIQHLETQSEYRILDELSKGRLGREKDINRDLYRQSSEERTEFFKEERNSYQKESVFQKIKALNLKLKAKVIEMVERKVILSTKHETHSTLDFLKSGNSDYEKIEHMSQELCQKPLPEEIKSEWVRGMFNIWLEHENPEKMDKARSTANINDAFHHFLEQMTHIKCEAFRTAQYPITLTDDDLQEIRVKPQPIRLQNKARLIASSYQSSPLKKRLEAKAKSRDQAQSSVTQLKSSDLVSLHEPKESVDFQIVPPSFSNIHEHSIIGGSTIKFLRENPMPRLTGTQHQQCAEYFQHLQTYLEKLKSFHGLENKDERISEFCHQTASNIFQLPFPPPPNLVKEIIENMLERYQSKKERVEAEEKNLYTEAFMTLDNLQRSQLLADVIKLNLSLIADNKVNPRFFAMLKQWENLIIPRDEAMSLKISSLSPEGTKPKDITLLREIEKAIHESPVSLEGICEGQNGLQLALTAFGQETEVDEKLRRLAERLGMRNGDVILAYQFITFYQNPHLLLSIEGINSTQGRELFERAFLNALIYAKTEDEAQELINFVTHLPINQKKHPCLLKSPHEVFIEELLQKAYQTLPLAFKDKTPSTTVTESFIDALTMQNTTKKTEPDATDRLFGFAKDINRLSLQISHELNKKPKTQPKIDELLAKLICSKLAYQLTFEEADSNTLANLDQNFEFKKEMGLARSHINQMQDHLIEFSTHLHDNGLSELFEKNFTQYQRELKFDGPLLKLTEKPSATPGLPGFITLGGNKSLDVLHGVIYQGNHKLGIMPAFIQSNITLQILGIDEFPYKPEGGGYIYAEEDENKVNTMKASILPKEDGSLIIQRELKTLDNDAKLLQYLPPNLTENIPIAFKRRIKAEHFFIDSSGIIHGFTADFTPIIKFSPDLLSGTLQDHHGNKISIQLKVLEDSTAHKMSQLFPADEIISLNKHTIYVPSIAKFIIYHPKTTNYLLSDTPIPDASTSTRHLKITPEGSAFTERTLSALELEERNKQNTKLTELNKELSIKSLEGQGIENKDAIEEITKKIDTCKRKIREITEPEHFIFVAKSPGILKLETELSALEKAQQASYQAFTAGEKNKGTLATNYNEAKEAYFEAKKKLDLAYQEFTNLRTYVDEEGVLKGKDFQSMLNIGTIEGKLTALIESLGANVPKKPLTSSELEQLINLKQSFLIKKEQDLTKDERFTLMMLIGIELQHHILERNACAVGRLPSWNREAYTDLLSQFKKFTSTLKMKTEDLPIKHFSELWRTIASEFKNDKNTLERFFVKTVSIIELEREPKPININTRTNQMPIESMGALPLVQYDLNKEAMDATQLELEHRLIENLPEFSDSVAAQALGYYYENFGYFQAKTLEKIFSATSSHPGIAGISQQQVADLFEFMKKEGWIQPVESMNTYRLSFHPSKCYSSVKVESYLTNLGFKPSDIHTISDRLETFLYQTAVNGGAYSIKPGARDDLIQKITEAQKKCKIEVLQAKDKIDAILAQSSPKISLAELNGAYLLNDYRKIISRFPNEISRNQTEIALQNAMTRWLYYKTELDHLNDVQSTMELGQDAKAVSMLHIKRNYALDKLLISEMIETPKDLMDQEQKMQRAFLLFESEFGHRCNQRQVQTFRGLILDDEMNPDKINSAQARMGFGKTTLLPLIALYKTGEKLVRFIVPKSALETNTADMSLTLSHLLEGRAVQDDFQRYRIEPDLEPMMGSESPRLKSLQNAKEDLKRRLALYQRVKEQREVLVQAPNVRNALECQAKIFLDLLLRINPKENLQRQELLSCISILNEIRSIETVSIFDELDATQDAATTDVNFTSGEKIPISSTEIYPLETITRIIHDAENKTPTHLAKTLLEAFHIKDDEDAILRYVTSLEVAEPKNVNASNCTQIYLMRALLADAQMLSLFTEKEPGTDFGVWFQNAPDGSKSYDRDALKSAKEPESTKPLLITVPYSAAMTPKPKGSRFDNPEVTAITTFLYYLDQRTEIEEIPHFEFLIDAMRKGLGEKPFLDASGSHLEPEFFEIYHEIKRLAEIDDPIFRNSERESSFINLRKKFSFRRMLARAIIQEQIQFDSGRANSNRYEQGTSHDVVIGFSGTAGDTSSHFKENLLDPASDGNMTLGIMGRENCQTTFSLDMASFTKADTNYTKALIQTLVSTLTAQSRALIDVGGLCKVPNQEVAKLLAIELRQKNPSIQGIIFYDDVTNTKKVLMLSQHDTETVVDLTKEMAPEDGNYFTYYDQSHSRGADIKQMDEAHALLTLNFAVTNNDYKQAIMRMRKIIDKSSGQSFSCALPNALIEQIFKDLKLLKRDRPTGLTGNDIAFWLRQKELHHDSKPSEIFILEMDSVIKNAILQQQAALTALMPSEAWSKHQMDVFSECIQNLRIISPFIFESQNDLKAKYGETYGEITKEQFVARLEKSFDERLKAVYKAINDAREKLSFGEMKIQEFDVYKAMKERIIKRREPQLKNSFIVPSARANTLAEAHTETENQSQSQSQSQSQAQTQTHTFSEVKNEEVVVEVILTKHDLPYQPKSIDYLSMPEAILQLPLANKTAHLEHLFTEDDPIRCSPMYQDVQNPIPPVRFFVAREQGNPKIILINQDEANQFLKTPVKGFSLYDLRKLTPLLGDEISFLKDKEHPLLKKMNFAAFRHPVTGETVRELSDSFSGILTPEQLKPSLEITYDKTQNLCDKDAVFQLNQWGFSGKSQETLSLNISQTPIEFTDQRGKVREMTGVTIKLGEGEAQTDVFISSKLNQRLTQEHHPKIKSILEQIQQEHSAATAERAKLIKKAQTERQKYLATMKKYDEEIKALELKREELQTTSSQQLKDGLSACMHAFLDLKAWSNLYHGEEALFYIQYFSMSKEKGAPEFGFQLDGQWFKEVEFGISHCLNNIYEKNHEAPMTQKKLAQAVDAAILKIFNIVEQRFSKSIHYKRCQTLFIDEIFAASRAPSHQEVTKLVRNKTIIQRELNTEVMIWNSKFEDMLRLQFFDIFTEFNVPGQPENVKFKALTQGIKNEILKARGAEPQLEKEELLENILEVLKEFAKAHFDDQTEATSFVRKIKNRLCYSSIAGTNEQKNVASMTEDIRHYVLWEFIGVLEHPNDEQKKFYDQMLAMVKTKLPTNDYHLPNRLLDFQTHPIDREEIKDAIEKAFARQNITTTSSELDIWALKVANRLAGHKALVELLNDYQPVRNRPKDFTPLEGQQRTLFNSSHEKLVKMDTQILDINDEISQLKAKRKTKISDIERDWGIVKEQLSENTKKMDLLNGELFSIKKLIDGIKKFFNIFSKEHQITVSEQESEATDFFDEHFNLPTIIQNKVSANIKLTFTPPKFYDTRDNLEAQRIRMHGLEEAIELRAHKSIFEPVTGANSIVEREAIEVQTRASQAIGLLSEEALLEQQRNSAAPKDAEEEGYDSLGDTNEIEPLDEMAETMQEMASRDKEVPIKHARNRHRFFAPSTAPTARTPEHAPEVKKEQSH